MKNQTLVLNQKYGIDKDSFQIDAFKFYLSDVKFFSGMNLIDAAVPKHHLINLEEKTSLQWKLTRRNSKPFDKISFFIGVDSLTQVSGAFGDALDPTLGMYWTWQSGFINLKIEGIHTQSKLKNRAFQYHIGGYSAPFSALQHLEFKVSDQHQMKLILDVEKLMAGLEFQNNAEIMSPGKEAVRVANYFSKLFQQRKQ